MTYDDCMQRISVHIPDETRRRIKFTAQAKSKAEAQVIREALEEGLDVIHPKSSSAQALLDLARDMKKIPTKGKVPRDASINHDYYLWGGEKKKVV